MTWDDVVAIGLELPGVEVSTSYGTPALKVRKKLVCRLREDGETLVLLQVEDIEQRFLMETQSDVFYKMPHYEGWTTILIRLPRVDPVQLQELLEMAWQRVAPKTLLESRIGKRIYDGKLGSSGYQFRHRTAGCQSLNSCR